uniref:Uncharacterized protein n=1 Tax=Lotharella globosa TaxID=91324 RepID=A0A7S3Z8L4_9EUKA|mmetsp:Transcript_33205/g.64214  ORF Transcript_33205/g.64214 Transcript_33205/m.64214 type:complete len:219 (+) Transcript_33205:106-762(+)|eukprot:CAMPEP_0167780424 /NCGR_PEP_ID=MMETSP0111_2-20121227/5351_1 /TAXON_ID=91324 /ORGANISM="Lotharella globosa, Strain CCCM811" /LENGTH=218 /DNA_ID=CAMNT_0007670937 /DNA_START=46 /DNA_END=702 /DNA_ORIENTATION=+
MIFLLCGTRRMGETHGFAHGEYQYAFSMTYCHFCCVPLIPMNGFIVNRSINRMIRYHNADMGEICVNWFCSIPPVCCLTRLAGPFHSANEEQKRKFVSALTGHDRRVTNNRAVEYARFNNNQSAAQGLINNQTAPQSESPREVKQTLAEMESDSPRQSQDQEMQTTSTQQQSKTISVCCPETSYPGDLVEFRHNGKKFRVRIPEGVQPGETFSVRADG